MSNNNSSISNKVINLFRSGSKSSKAVKPTDKTAIKQNAKPTVAAITTRISSETGGGSSPPRSGSSESILSSDIHKQKSSPTTRSSSSLALDNSAAVSNTVQAGAPISANVQASSSTVKLSTMDSSRSESNTHHDNSHSHTNCMRFMVHEDGSHEHHLKNARRQEKLTSMIKNIMKTNNYSTAQKKLRNEAKSAVPDIITSPVVSTPITPKLQSPLNPSQGGPQYKGPPSLFAGYMKQVVGNDGQVAINGPVSGAFNGDQKVMYQDNETNEDIQQAPLTLPPHFNDSLSFAEKYGSCKEILGKGAFGVVRICHKKVPENPKVEKLYAVKEFKRKATEPKEKFAKRLTSEFCISSSLHHTNIVDTLDLFQDANGDYCEVMEYCAGGDLFTLIIAAGKLEYMEADCFFKQLLCGVVYMHDMGVCHRDLKPENLILTHDGVLKITDFGNSECFKMAWEEDIHLSGGVCGSSPYIAPEEYVLEEFDPRPVDIWACGVIYMAMRTGRQLWTAAKKDDPFYNKYLQGRRQKSGYEPIESLKRARCRNVIYSMLDPAPHRRINGKQILNSEWGREIKVCYDKQISVTSRSDSQQSRVHAPITVK